MIQAHGGTDWPAMQTRGRVGGLPARQLAEYVGYVLFALFVFFTCFTFLRPSPYDFAATPAMLVWLILGVRLHRSSLLFVGLLLAYKFSLVVSLVPYFAEPEPTLWTIQSLYLMVTAVFFVMFFAHQTERRVELALKAYLASCVVASLAGILSYSIDTGVLFVMDGRAAGVFEDPNVLGSFLILGVLYLLRRLLTGEAGRPMLSLACLLLLLSAVFLSFSRGSWAATMAGIAFMSVVTLRTSSAPVRRRIMSLALALFGLCALLVVGLLSVGDVAERFENRAQVSQDYDEGETGRFGNQLRSIPMLLDRPTGFGPLRFRLIFGIEPHNSYIGGFANGGWVGGLAFIGLVFATIYVGWRLCLTPSPFQRQAQIVFPALLMFFLQALQIDIDHWRHVYLMLGMVWGLEAGRCRWVATERRRSAARPALASGPARPALPHAA